MRFPFTKRSSDPTLPTTSFPSGHTLIFTAVVGFLWYLIHQSRLPILLRLTLLTASGGIVVLMGTARIYSGEHWASDALAGHLIGGSWLAIGKVLQPAQDAICETQGD